MIKRTKIVSSKDNDFEIEGKLLEIKNFLLSKATPFYPEVRAYTAIIETEKFVAAVSINSKLHAKIQNMVGKAVHIEHTPIWDPKDQRIKYGYAVKEAA